MDAATVRAGQKPGEVSAEKVAALFREAWPNRNPPDLCACSFVATRLNTVRRMGVKRPKSPPVLGKAAEPARAFLQHLPDARKKLEAIYDIITDYASDSISIYLRPEFRDVIELIDKMLTVERDVRALLDAPFPFADRRDAPSFIADAAQKVWHRAGAKVPHSASPKSPLCVFGKGALALIGCHYSAHSVSDLLRGRYNRPRSRRRLTRR